MAVAACNPPPLAPDGTVIFLIAGASSVAATGSVEIVAVLMEQGGSADTTSTDGRPAGTPVQDGTLVSFITNLGRIEPAEARTDNGTVKVRFVGDGRSGTATILAFSGAVRAETTLKVGTAAVETLALRATQLPIGLTGGSSTITATVLDASGNTLPGLTIQFSSTRGTLSAGSAVTNPAGEASVLLSTTADATVTATVGTKTATVTVALRPS